MHEKCKLTLACYKQQDGRSISPSLPLPVCPRGGHICTPLEI